MLIKLFVGFIVLKLCCYIIGCEGFKCKYFWNFWFKNVIWYGKLVYRVIDKFGKVLRCAVSDILLKDNSTNAIIYEK